MNKETGCGGVDKTQLAQNRIQSRALVNILHEKWGMSWYVNNYWLLKKKYAPRNQLTYNRASNFFKM